MFTNVNEPTVTAIEDAALHIANAISVEEATTEYPELLPHFTALVLKECGNYLNEPQHRLMYAAAKLLLAFCKGSLFMTIRVIQSSFPAFYKHFGNSPQLNSRCPIVEVLGLFLEVLCQHVAPIYSEAHQSKAPTPSTVTDPAIEDLPRAKTPATTTTPTTTPPAPPLVHDAATFNGFDDDAGELVHLREPVLEMLQTCLDSPDERLCQLGVAAAEYLLRLPKAVPDESRVRSLVSRLVRLAIFHASPRARRSAVVAVGRLRFRPCRGTAGDENLFDVVVLPILVNHLTEAVAKLSAHDEPMETEGDPRPTSESTETNFAQLCHLMSSTCVTTQGFETATDKLLTASESQGVGTRVGRVILSCINELADKGLETDDNHRNADALKNKILPRVKSIFIDDWDSTPWLRDPAVVDEGATLARKVVQLMDEKEAGLEWGETHALLMSHAASFSTPDTRASKSALFPLLLSVGASLPRSCHLHKFPHLLQNLLELATTTAVDPRRRSSACKFFAAIVNKVDNESELTAITDDVVKRVDDAEKSGNLTLDLVRVWVWTTKALALRSHRLSKTFASRLIPWLSSSSSSSSSAEISSFVGVEAFAAILAEDDDVMAEEQRAIRRKMHRQRFFLQTLPLLIEASAGKEEAGSASLSRLAAVASMLPHLPQQALVSELPSVLPILVKALSCEDRVLQESVVRSLLLLLKDSPLSLASHTDTVIPKLLLLAQTSSSMEVRISTLKCLRVLIASSEDASAGLAPSLLMPHKPRVVKELAKCLDDKKRLVRREAVVTRNVWYLV